MTLFLCAIFFGFSGDVSIWVFLVPWLISSFCLVRTIQYLNFFKNSTDDFLRWHGFPIFFVFQFFVTASWFGPLIYVFFVEYQISHRKYLAARNLSLEEQKAEYEIKQRLFNSKKDEFEKKVRIKGSDDDRERDFLIQFPSANLRRAPRNARDFELIAESWMKFWGQFDAQVTQYNQDGGLDVVSGDFAAQVKFYADKPVGRPEVQQLYGAAIGENKKPVFLPTRMVTRQRHWSGLETRVWHALLFCQAMKSPPRLRCRPILSWQLNWYLTK